MPGPTLTYYATETPVSIEACCIEWDRIARMPGVFYCNETWLRCSDPMCRDCSTFAASGLLSGFPGSVDECANSFSIARWCRDTPRPQFFIDRFGPGIGTFITKAQAETVVCFGFRGSNLGTEPDSTGDGHIEVCCSTAWPSALHVPSPTLSVGAHSHATGVGYDDDGIDNHQLEWWAVPPPFLAEMAPPAWKVQPQMQEQLFARLKNPQGGWWEGYADGRVDLLKEHGGIVHGGMVTPEDKQAFAGRTLARLTLRWYRPKGSITRKAGYTIHATSGETYQPSPQH